MQNNEKSNGKTYNVSIPPLVADTKNFSMLSLKPKKNNYRKKLVALLNTCFDKPRSYNTWKVWFLYPEKIPNGKIAEAMGECLGRVLQYQLEDYERTLIELGKETDRCQSDIDSIKEVINTTKKGVNDYES